jgi:hypothetical protein
LAQPEDAVVRIVTAEATCTGTLITADLVLTAHHCVVERADDGTVLARDLPAKALEIEIGGDYLPWGHAMVKAVVAPPCGYDGGPGDIAILVLSRKLVGLPTMQPRLHGVVAIGEGIEPIGFGLCPLSDDGVHRIDRQGGQVQELGPAMIRAPASVCPGDSGGPARSMLTGEIVGVVSAAVMDESDKTRDRSYFTRLDVWRDLFATAQLVEEGHDRTELPPVSCEPP